ncbi:MAG: 50S ribosomal protein L15 [Phycisphaeraceae bacterium]|nr:50S ribosomal protein L15 [Phycisphaeraceae bacterium]
MMIHEITCLTDANRRRKRVGRGRGSGSGKTSGRGHKGAGSRSGASDKVYFEGGQMPLQRRLPKRGFSNADFRTEYSIVNLQLLEGRFDDGATVTAETLHSHGLIRDTKRPVKILGEGEVSKKFHVTAEKFSASARSKIEAAGGSVTEIVKPKWRRERPAKTKG